MNDSELDVIDVELKEVGDGRNEAGLAGAWRAMEEITSLPCAANAGIVVSAGGEAEEVVADGVSEIRIYCQSVKGGGMVKGNRGPATMRWLMA